MCVLFFLLCTPADWKKTITMSIIIRVLTCILVEQRRHHGPVYKFSLTDNYRGAESCDIHLMRM